ncbi:hypothetical protein [Haladaptatus sp.]|uniref:hypothetical protein n=1 Tax=Haladaptatus sp. TaxID=1973141 RepID=UPI003C535290
MKQILKPLSLVLLLLLAGCNGATFGSTSTTGTQTASTTSPVTTGSTDRTATGQTTSVTTDRTTTSTTKPCTVTNESSDGAAWVVKPTMDGTKVMLMTQWNRSATVTKLDATLDGKRLFRAYPERDAPNATGWGRYVGTVPLAGQLRVELYDNGTQVGRYNASVVCER